MHLYITIFIWYSVYLNSKASLIKRYGTKYLLGFFPITVNDSHVNEKELRLALTLESQLKYSREFKNWGFVIFDTGRDNKDLTKWLVEIQLNATFRIMATNTKRSKCCTEQTFQSKIHAVMGSMSMRSALHIQNILSLRKARILIKLDENKNDENRLYLNSPFNIRPVADINAVDLLKFLIKHHNWHKIVVITEYQRETDMLFFALNFTNAYYTYILPGNKEQKYNKEIYEKVARFANNRTSIDAIVLWTYYYRVNRFLVRRLDPSIAVVTGYSNYRGLGKDIRDTHKIMPLQVIRHDEIKATTTMWRTVITNKWMKNIFQVMPRYKVKEYFTIDIPFYRAIQQVSIQYPSKSTPEYIYNEYIKNGTNLSLEYSSPQCEPGYYQIWMSKYSSKNIFKHTHQSSCIKCSSNYFKTGIDSSLCIPCPNNTQSNNEHTTCLARKKVFVEYSSSTAKVMYILILLESCSMLFIIAVFIRFRDTPTVKSSSKNLSFLQLVAHCILTVIPLILIGEPSQEKCNIFVFSIGFLYAVIMGSIFAKTHKLLTIFQSLRKMSSKEVVITEAVQYFIVFILVTIQICLTLLGFVSDPFHFVRVLNDANFTETLSCPKQHFINQFLYILLLSVICLVQAFRARKLPINYNETKYIVFGMISNIIIIAIFLISLPIADVTDIDNFVFEIFKVVFASNSILVAILNGYKLWIMIFRPKQNTKEDFRLKRFRF